VGCWVLNAWLGALRLKLGTRCNRHACTVVRTLSNTICGYSDDDFELPTSGPFDPWILVFHTLNHLNHLNPSPRALSWPCWTPLLVRV